MWKWFNTLIASNTFSENVVHVLAGYGAVLTVARFGGRRLPWCLTFLVLAAVKEYWYDENFEIPKQTELENTADFLGYILGIALGAIVTHGT